MSMGGCMIKLASGGVAIAALFFTLAVSNQAAAEKVYSVEISPSGSHYAILRDVGNQQVFTIYSADDAAAKPAAIGLGGNKVEDWEWGGDNHILLRISGEVSGVDTVSGVKTLKYSRWLSISRETGEFRTMFGNEQGNDYFYLITAAGALVAALPQDGERSLFAREYVAVKPKGPSRLKEGDEELLYSLIEANLRTGDPKRKMEGEADTISWITTAGGAPIARIDQQQRTKRIEILAADESGEAFDKVGELDGDLVEAEKIRFLGQGYAPHTIQVLKGAGDGARLYEYNLDTGEFGAPIGIPGPVTYALYDPREARVRIVYVAGGAGETPYHLDASDQKTKASLEKALAGAMVTVASKSLDGGRMIIRADYADKPEEYYFYDKPGKRLELVASN